MNFHKDTTQPTTEGYTETNWDKNHRDIFIEMWALEDDWLQAEKSKDIHSPRTYCANTLCQEPMEIQHPVCISIYQASKK